MPEAPFEDRKTVMQVNVQSTGSLERRMEVSVPKEQIQKAIDERLQRVSRTAKLKGFRPGKAPIKIIRQQFGDQVRQEVLSELMQQSFSRAINEAKLTPAAGPRIEPITSGPDEDLKYRAVFEVYPEISLQSVEGLAVTRPVAEVAQSDIEAMVQNLREQRPSFTVVERESREGRPRDDGFRRPARRQGLRGQQGRRRRRHPRRGSHAQGFRERHPRRQGRREEAR
jgi:trigger factor